MNGHCCGWKLTDRRCSVVWTTSIKGYFSGFYNDKHDSKKEFMIMLRSAILVLWITAITSAHISEADVNRLDENEDYDEIEGTVAYGKGVFCADGFRDYVAGRVCEGEIRIGFVSGFPSDKILPSVAGPLGDHVHEYVPNIKLDADTINSLEALGNRGSLLREQEDAVDGGLQESVFIGGVASIKLECVIDLLKFNDGEMDKLFGCVGFAGSGTSIQPDELAVQAFTVGTKHSGRPNDEMNPIRVRSSRLAAASGERPPSKFFRGLRKGEEETRVGKTGADETEDLVFCEVGLKGRLAVVECEGTFTVDFAMDTNTDSMVQSLTARLNKHIHEYLPKKIRFGKDIRLALQRLEKVGLAGEVLLYDDDDPEETLVDIAAEWTVSFGCKIVVSKKKSGMLTKSVQCGGTGGGGIGVLPTDDDNEL